MVRVLNGYLRRSTFWSEQWESFWKNELKQRVVLVGAWRNSWKFPFNDYLIESQRKTRQVLTKLCLKLLKTMYVNVNDQLIIQVIEALFFYLF